MAAIGSKAIISAGDENIVIQAGGSAENKAGVVQTIAGGEIVSYGFPRAEGFVEITRVIGQIEHVRVNPEMIRVEILKLRGRKRGYGTLCTHLSHQRDLSAGSLALVSTVIGGSHAKFLNGVLGQWQVSCWNYSSRCQSWRSWSVCLFLSEEPCPLRASVSHSCFLLMTLMAWCNCFASFSTMLSKSSKLFTVAKVASMP